MLLKPPRLRPRHWSRWRPFFGAARGAHVDAYSCTVGHDRCQVGVLRELFEHVGPNTVLFPVWVAFEDTVPLAKVGWQFTPLCAGAQNPVNCFDETATPVLLPRIGTRVSLQKCVQFLPLMVGKLIGRHPTFVATLTESFKRQRDLIDRYPRLCPLLYAGCIAFASFPPVNRQGNQGGVDPPLYLSPSSQI